MIIQYIKNKFIKQPVFYDKEGTEIKYIQYFKSEQMITIQTENGIEKIPVIGLDKH